MVDHYYFAYGSNMNPDRVTRRKMKFSEYHGAVLDGFRLAFNKRSVDYPGAASANVVREIGHKVEGVAYKLHSPQEIETMDPFEGYPYRYVREILPVDCNGRVVGAWVYIAHADYISEGLKPNRWYLQHLLAGRPFLSVEYFGSLASTECLPNSDIEPQ